MREFCVGSKMVGDGHPAFVIAEVGINHEGDLDACFKMVEAATRAGADAIKLQTIVAEKNYAPDTISYKLFKQAELSREDTARVFAQCADLGVEIFTTVGDLETLDWISRLNPCAYKISSGLLSCIPVTERAADYGQPVLMSTGMAEIEDIDQAMDVAARHPETAFGLFQCTSLYPAPEDTLDLASISWLRERYDVPVGFSDHTKGVEAAAISVAAGAVMIEKHFTYDINRDSYDHRLSLEEDGFAEMVSGIRRVEEMMGQREKRLLEEVRNVRRTMSRYLAVSRDLPAGTVLAEDNLGFFRFSDPGAALPAARFEAVLGQRLKMDLKQGAAITAELLENG